MSCLAALHLVVAKILPWCKLPYAQQKRMIEVLLLAGDIADPQHPFRFHQVVSSLRRTVTPVNPVEASTQPQPSNPAEQASACWHTAQKPSKPSGFSQTPLGPTADAQPGQEQSSHAGTRFAQSATDCLTADTADQPDFTADNLHNQASDPPVQTGNAGQDVNRRGGTNFQGTGSDAEVLQHSTMSRGGPVPGSQVSGLTPLDIFCSADCTRRVASYKCPAHPHMLTGSNAVHGTDCTQCILVC